MNYYGRHIGDYLKDTAHLSLLEHGVYTRLMDVYYTREALLPEDQVARLIGARSKEEKEALAAVLGEFFLLHEGAWSQLRCDREIARYQDKQRKAKASADARWAQSDRNADASTDAMRTHSEGNAPSNQSPVTIPKSNTEPKGSTSTGKLPTCKTKEVIDLYHRILPELPEVRVHTKARVAGIRKMWTWVLTSKKSDQSRRAETAEQALTWFENYFNRARANDFLMGRVPRIGEHADWQCTIDFLMTDKGLLQVIEKTREAA